MNNRSWAVVELFSQLPVSIPPGKEQALHVQSPGRSILQSNSLWYPKLPPTRRPAV